MATQEAKKKNQETLKLLRKEKENLKKIQGSASKIKESVSKLEDSLYKERSRLEKEIKGLGQRIHRRGFFHSEYDVVRIGATAYSFDHHGEFQHGLRKNKSDEFDLYDVVGQIIPPSKNKSHLGFNVGQQIRIKQEGPVPFRYNSSSFYFPAGADIIESKSQYILGRNRSKKIKNPIVRTTIKCFYEDGKALVEYYHSREGSGDQYFEVVDLSNYEICSHLEWDSKKGLEKSFAKYLEANGLTEKIKFEDKFGFRVGEPIYIKSHEIILDNPADYGIYGEVLSHVLEKDLYFMQSFRVDSKGIESEDWKVFGFVGDNVLVECNETIHEFSHFELFSPEEIGLIIDLDYRLKKEKYFARLIYREDRHGGPILEGIKKIK